MNIFFHILFQNMVFLSKSDDALVSQIAPPILTVISLQENHDIKINFRKINKNSCYK